MNSRGTKIFYVPTIYLFKVRLEGNIRKFLSWWFLLIAPTLGYTALIDDSLGFMGLSRFFILAFSVVSYYELGYMHNDTLSLSREKDPTIRLNDDEYDYCLTHLPRILATRLIIVAILMVMYVMLNPCGLALKVTLFFFLILLPIFGIYNNIRGLASVLFYPILVSVRYMVLIFPCVGSPDFGIITLLLLLSYPIEIGIERFSMPKKRYGFMGRIIPDEKSKARFRALYYLVIIILLAPVWINYPAYCLPILLIGIYRWLRLLLQI